MRNNINTTILFSMIICLGMFSCVTPSKLYPYHTTIEGIYGLKTGMSMSTVEKTLGSVKPFDVKANFEDGYKVLEYKYMHRFQKVPTSKKNNPEYVSGGNEVFKDESSLFVVFDTKDNMLFFITEAGKERAESSLATANDLNMIKLYPELFVKKVKPVKKSSVLSNTGSGAKGILSKVKK
jgi:hypothetical protein